MRRIVLLLIFSICISLLTSCGGTEEKESLSTDSINQQEITKEEHDMISQDDKKDSEENKTVLSQEQEDTELVVVEQNRDSSTPSISQTNQQQEKQESDSQTVKLNKETQTKEVSEGTNSTSTTKVEQTETVTLLIKGDEETGVILQATQIPIEEGDTVLDVLQKATRQYRIPMEYRGKGATAYIEGIYNLYEFDKGPKSGWMYSVNGVFKQKGAGMTEVQPDDEIQWLYTLDLGKDL